MGDIADGIISGDFDELTGEYIGKGGGFPRSNYRKPVKKQVSMEKLFNIQKILIDNGYVIVLVKPIDYGFMIRTESGAVINLYSTGKVVLQGKEDLILKTQIK